VYLHPLAEAGNMLGKVQAAGLQAIPQLEAAFYYDLTLQGGPLTRSTSLFNLKFLVNN